MSFESNIGWKFPFSINPITGKIETTTLEEDIRQSIKIVLNTYLGERLLYKSYGNDLNRFMFEIMSYPLINDMREDVQNCILRWEKRIEDLKTDLYYDEGDRNKVVVDLKYRIKSQTDSDFEYVSEEAFKFSFDLL